MGRSRNPNFRSSIYKGADGYWHGRVTVGLKDDGKPDRRHVRGTTRAVVSEKVRGLERDRDRGSLRKAGEQWRVSDWLEHWLGNIVAPPRVTLHTHDGYRVDVERHLIPGVGGHWLDRLQPEHLERLYAKMQAAGLAAGTAHHVHRTARAALNEAVRRGHLVRNPVVHAKPPTTSDEEIEPYDVPEIRRLLEAASMGRNSARWAVALALGLRQGEALALKWDDVDLDKGTLRIRRSRIRPRYEHGCGGSCGSTPGRCPQRRNARPVTGDVKSKAGRRTIGLPEPLVALLRKHRDEQAAERAAARQLWQDEGWVFATPLGAPLNHNSDYHEWKQLLATAGLRESRLHDARHAAATMLLILRQPERTVMSLMGWSSAGMTRRYQHVTDSVRSDVAAQVGSLIWDAQSTGTDEQTIVVQRRSLAAILPLVEDAVVQAGPDDLDLEDLQSALTDLRAAMTGRDNNTRGERNETRNETTGP